MFDIQGNKIKLSTDDLAIPPFKDHFNNAEDKSIALKEIEYVVWLHKWNTPYEAYPSDRRASVVAKDVFGDEKYKPTAEVLELSKRFLELQETPGTRLLSASRGAAEGLITVLEAYYKRLNASQNYEDLDEAIKITRILKDVGNIIKSLDIAMKQSKAEQIESGRVKGGGVIGMYETVK